MFHIQNSPDLHQDLDTFFRILNDPLRKQILYHLHQSLMKKVTFFKNYTSVEQCFFICKLKPVLFLPDDIVIREGETGDNVYFLNKGELSVWIDSAANKT
jgi:DNA-binding transcriptional ArsR family regulator